MSNDQTFQSEPTALCASFAKFLPILDGPGIEASTAARVRAHLSTCFYCQTERAIYNRIDAAVRLHFAPDGPPYYETEDIMRDLLQDQETLQPDSSPRRFLTPKPGKTDRPRRFLSGLAALAAVLVTVLISVALFSGWLFHKQPGGVSTTQTATPSATPSAPVPSFPADLQAVSMLSPTEGWAVGVRTSLDQSSTAALMHYANGKWTLVESGVHGILTSIAMLSSTDGWAVGNALGGGPHTSVGILLHYDGTTWKQFENPTPLGDLDQLQMVSSTEGWAISNLEQIVHYDGHSWTAQPLPASLEIGTKNSVGIYGLSMGSATEGWAVGSLFAGKDQPAPRFGLILHYTGGQWTKEQLIDNANLNAVSMVSGSDGWALGSRNNASIESDILLHYTGSEWVETAFPQSDSGFGKIFMTSARDGWIVASGFSKSSDDNRLLLLHYDGTQWGQVYAPQEPLQNPGTGALSLTINSIAVPSPGDGWAVGVQSVHVSGEGGNPPSDTDTALLLHYHNGVWALYQG